MAPDDQSKSPTARLVVGLLIVAICGLYASFSLQRQWFPHDEGQLGDAAERILAGELPHRDFDDAYTGGLSYLNALSFQWFGVRSESIRWMLWLFYLPYIGAIYWIASRAVSPIWAAAVAFLAGCYSIPIYSAGMPSWYNLFLASLGTAALLRHIDSGRARWLVVAGVCGGLSILIKITGLYFVAAGLLFLLFREQNLSQRQSGGSRWFSWLTTSSLVAFGLLGLVFLRSRNTTMSLAHFVLPLEALAAYLVWSEWRSDRDGLKRRIQRLSGLVVPFLAGVASVLTPLVLFYASQGALGDLYRGLFVAPRLRLEHAAMPLPAWYWLVAAIPMTVLLAFGLRKQACAKHKTVAWSFCGLSALFVMSSNDRVFHLLFQALRNQIPLIVLVVLVILIMAQRGRLQVSRPRREELFLLAAVTLMVSLVQYPFSGGVYFFYAAPLAVLAVLFLVDTQPNAPRGTLAMTLMFLILFAAFRLDRTHPVTNYECYAPNIASRSLGLQRCGLTVSNRDADLYQKLIPLVQSLSKPGSYVYAAPDCPEVNFLSGRKSPLDSHYDFFREKDGSNERLLQLLDARQVRVVVIKKEAIFSSQISRDLLDQLDVRFPNSVSVDRERPNSTPVEAFRIMWRG